MCGTGEQPCGNYDSVCQGFVGCARPEECRCNMVGEKEVCTIGLFIANKQVPAKLLIKDKYKFHTNIII